MNKIRLSGQIQRHVVSLNGLPDQHPRSDHGMPVITYVLSLSKKVVKQHTNAIKAFLPCNQRSIFLQAYPVINTTCGYIRNTMLQII